MCKEEGRTVNTILSKWRIVHSAHGETYDTNHLYLTVLKQFPWRQCDIFLFMYGAIVKFSLEFYYSWLSLVTLTVRNKYATWLRKHSIEFCFLLKTFLPLSVSFEIIILFYFILNALFVSLCYELHTMQIWTLYI